MATAADNSTSRPAASSSSCPCKLTTWRLSSFTAAEFGDVEALSQALSKQGSNSTDGITPLHLAAQHGHAAATWMLLNHKAHPVDGGNGAPCTPLHRASFSGATATMSLLLEAKARLLARDQSFGDQRTPLHKAAAGGRYLAVALLLDAARQQSLLQEVLQARDRQDETPFQIAQALHKNQSEERQSVARWDAVAGGTVADWGKCVALLQKADEEVRSKAPPQAKQAKALPAHPFGSLDSCLDCTGPNGECVTSSWSAAFQKALKRSVSFEEEPATTLQEEGKENTGIDNSARQPPIHKVELQTVPPRLVEEEGNTPMGRECEACRVKRFVLFPMPDGTLVCKKCKRKRQK